MARRGQMRIIEGMVEPQDLTDEQRPATDDEKLEQFDVHRWAEAYLAEQPEIPLELVGVPFS